MTDYETIARQKLSLAVDNTQHRQIPYRDAWIERMGYLWGLIAGVVLIYSVVWPTVCVLFSLG